MAKKIDALVYAYRYNSAITDYEDDPYYAEDAAYFREMAIKKLKKVTDPRIKKEVTKIIEETDQILKKERKNIIRILSGLSDMDKKELKYLERI
ncbi:Hypothetical protein MPV1_25 [Marinitoga phage MPV1]|uniref:Uncharacterized protein n=1 Tax=Marinitoga piezophila (strain DSM 14283 / JCM 11233 / KA3) TaxID=443254 RepID=H2J4B8_MARPK|nr:hypothetical protein [Marinitoga piezophila]AEX84773.1 hypothetical protein Marpi_0323 [Marinitoga piezophila KA3]